MRARYLGAEPKEGLGSAEVGYYTPDDDILISARDHGFEPGSDLEIGLVDALEPMIERDNAYRVEVVDISDGIVIGLYSGETELSTYLEEQLGRRERGTEEFLFQIDGRPVLPGNMDNSHFGLEMYADWALGHGSSQGIEMELDREKLFREDNLGPR